MGENYFGITDTGKQRTNNEDRFVAKSVAKGQFVLACVIDGVGGYVGGEVAAQLTADAVVAALQKPGKNLTGQMLATLENANERIIREKALNPQNDQMACVVTLAVVDIEKNIFYFAHVGDTRLYLFRDGSLIKITKDHSSVGFLEESGRLTEEAAMAHPKRNEVNKALGYEAKLPSAKDFIDTGESPFLPGDLILLCSDGLTDMITSTQIIAILKDKTDLPGKGKLLVKAANEAGGRDNITVVLVQNNKEPVQHEATRPVVPQKKTEPNVDAQTKIADQVAAGKPADKTRKSNINYWLLACCVLLLAAVAWLLLKQPKKPVAPEVIMPVNTVTRQRSNRERIFLDSINSAPNKTVRLIDSQNFVISDTVLIKNDSLHIIGNGISFVRDSVYNGPAFVLAPNCKYILFDSLDLENFNVGIVVLNKGLQLKNVRFKNCLASVQFQPQLPNGLVSGAQAESIFKYRDSARQ